MQNVFGFQAKFCGGCFFVLPADAQSFAFGNWCFKFVDDLDATCATRFVMCNLRQQLQLQASGYRVSIVRALSIHERFPEGRSGIR